jgi:hypothetical protein
MSTGSPFTQLWKQDAAKQVAEKTKIELVEASTPTPTPTPTPTSMLTATSPEKNFTKVANSIKPEIFRGTSQKTYMALYQLTRGAIIPKRTVKVTRNELMAYADVSEVTLVKHLTYLEKIARLVKKTSIRGDNDGATYEVFIPEEVGKPTPTPTPIPIPTPTSIKKVDAPSIQKVDVGGGVNLVENTDTYSNPKTSLKTNTKNDDEAFAQFIEKFQSASYELTGKKLSQREVESLGNLADLLILELKTAACRTNGVSNVPAFLTEVLRRQFFANRQGQSSNKSTKTKIDTVGKSESETFEINPLDEKGREEALAQLQEFAADDFLQDFRKWYTSEDWTWMMNKLESSDQ